MLAFSVAGSPAAFARFDGKLTTPKAWFELNLLLASSWTDLTPVAMPNKFGIDGDDGRVPAAIHGQSGVR